MPVLATVAIVIVALLHLCFLVLEMFFWTRPAGRRVFRTTQEFADASATLAANQGLYNGFLSAGLLWGLALGQGGRAMITFCLMCALVAGLYGAASIGRKILVVQALPAAVALALFHLAPG
jgi:putative membrane protein